MNLFANCLLALDARTGKRLWHFQNVHRDGGDYDDTAAPQLTTIKKDGKSIDVVAMAGKTGFLYVFNRVTGVPIWPIESGPCPRGPRCRARRWPTQPFPTAPPPFARQKFTADDINPYLLTPEQQETFKKRISAARNEGLHANRLRRTSTCREITAGEFREYLFESDRRHRARDQLRHSRHHAPAETGGGRSRTPRWRRWTHGARTRVYQRDCQSCHGADLTGTPKGTPLVGVTSRLSGEQMKSIVNAGKGDMPSFPHITQVELDAVLGYLAAPESAGRGGFGGRGRGTPAAPLPPGPVVQTGPAVTRPGGGAGASAAAAATACRRARRSRRRPSATRWTATACSRDRETTQHDDHGLHLNTGTIRWQVPLGDDPRLIAKGFSVPARPAISNLASSPPPVVCSS
jgi:quinoprotein glucose dehydrogenase